MKKKLAAVLLFCGALSFFLMQTLQAFGIVAFHADFLEKKATVVIDAGHGGEDGGAVGVNGVPEKQLNLAIALELARCFQGHNFEVILVRDGDYSVGDQSLPTVAQRKKSDLKNRLKLVEETGDCLFLSIHQNHFSQSKYRGAQVFYSGNDPESKELAEALRDSIVTSLQPENRREIKQAESSVYLMAHCRAPAVLIECGFLSNFEEAELLCTEVYQKEMAAAIYNGVVDYLERKLKEGKTSPEN